MAAIKNRFYVKMIMHFQESITSLEIHYDKLIELYVTLPYYK